MGFGRFDYDTYSTYVSNTVTSDGCTKSANQIFKTRWMHPDLDGTVVSLRESRDSVDNPRSTPIIIGLDVTGSMGFIAAEFLARYVGDVMSNILNNNIVTDPQLLFMAIGDVVSDAAPNQMTQFESDIRIAEQLSLIYNEGRGGGNDTESYDLVWYMAAKHTSTDSFEKRGKKGYLFTIGDEMFPHGIRDIHASKFTSDKQHQVKKYEALDLYNDASEKYDCFHIIIKDGSFAKRHLHTVENSWKSKIGNRALVLDDYKKLSDLMMMIINVNEGTNPDDYIDNDQFSQSTKNTLKRAFS